MKEIPLSQGKVAVVDNVDYEYLNQWKWCAHKCGKTFYAVRTEYKGGKRNIYMHQLIAERMNFKHLADHINRNGLDNRRKNLRDATQKQNLENASVRVDNISGQKGVYWFRRDAKWHSQITHNGKRVHLGYFDKLEDAINARKEAERKYFTHGSNQNHQDRVR